MGRRSKSTIKADTEEVEEVEEVDPKAKATGKVRVRHTHAASLFVPVGVELVEIKAGEAHEFDADVWAHVSRHAGIRSEIGAGRIVVEG